MAKNPRLLQSGNDFVRNYLHRQAPVDVTKLSNGLKVATQEIPSHGMSTVAIHAKSGSRFETIANEGVSALMQRAITKGTATRSGADIEKELRSIGSNGVKFETERERHTLSIDCLGADAPKAAALLADIAQNARLDDQTVDAARFDAIDALKETENCIPSVVQNNMYANAFESTKLDEIPGNHMYANPLGNGEFLKTATAEDVKAFYNGHFKNANTINLVATGDIDSNAVREAAEKVCATSLNFFSKTHFQQGFGGIEAKTETATDKRYVGGQTRMDIGTPVAPYQQHVALGWEVCPANSPDVVPLQLLLQVFGNYDRLHNDMTSNWGIRFNLERFSTQMGNSPLEEMKTFFNLHSDTGLMGFHLAYKLGAGDEGWILLAGMQAEWCRYCMRLNPYQVEVGKNLLKSKLLFENDGCDKANVNIGKQLVNTGGVAPLEQQFARVNDLTTNQVCHYKMYIDLFSFEPF